MRNVGGIVLGGVWILLLLAYSAPFWVPSWDFAVSFRGPVWMAATLLVLALLLPPLVLGVVTWKWIAR